MITKTEILENKKTYREVFWLELLYVSFDEKTIEQLYKEVSDNENTNDSSKDYLGEISKIISGELTIHELMDNVVNDKNGIELQLRNIDDEAKGIVREVLYPEKLIGKKLSVKKYNSQEIETFEILSIKHHYYDVEPSKEHVVYIIVADWCTEENKYGCLYPLTSDKIQSLIDKQEFIHAYTHYGESRSLEYKIIP